MMLLGTQDRDFFPQDLTEKFKFVKSIGFECFEIDGKVLMEKPDEIKRAVRPSGLQRLRRIPRLDRRFYRGEETERHC